MKNVLFWIFTLLCTLLAGSGFADKLFINATLTNLESGEQTLSRVLVTGHTITAIAPDLTAANVETIDLAGGYLMPGLAEMHAHVPPLSNNPDYLPDLLFLWAANGVTTIRGMLGDPVHLKLRANLQAQTMLGPRLITSGPSFNGNSVSSPAQGSKMVREQHALGYDFLKMHPGLKREEFDAIAQQANALNMPFAGHVSLEVGLLDTLKSGQMSIDHLDGYLPALVANEGSLSEQIRSAFFGFALLPYIDTSKISAVVQATINANAWVVPTQTLMENHAFADDLDTPLDREEIQYLPKRLLSRYTRSLAQRTAISANIDEFLSIRRQLILALHTQGANLLLGSDAPQIFNVPGFSTHRELASMSAAGLTPAQVWITATSSPARFLKLEDTTGRIQVGLDADLIWLTENPLSDIRHSQSIAGVMLRGQWLSATQIKTGLAAISRRNQ